MKSMDDYEYYLFDWDGTLARTIEIWIDAMELQLKNFGVKPSRATIGHHLGDFTIAQVYGLSPEQAASYDKKVVAMVMARLSEAALYDDAIAVLTALRKQGRKLALITSSKQEWLQLVLKRHALSEAFDVIVTLDDVTHHKPHPEVVELAIKKLGCQDKTKALVLGDTDKDLRAAHAAGVDSLLFYPPSHEEVYDLDHLQSFNPTHLIRSWREFIDQIT